MPLFRAVERNLKSAERAYTHVLDLGKQHLKKSRDFEASQSAKTAALLLAGTYESRLHWLLNHPDTRLEESEISSVLRNHGLIDKWEALFEIALASRHTLSTGVDTARSDIPAVLDEAQRERYYLVRKLARRHLRTLIDARNSLAHGEWEVALNKTATGLNPSRTKFIERLTLFRVVCAANLLNSMWKLYFDALVTHEAFERDFERYANSMKYADLRINNASESKWIAQIRR